MRIISLFAAVVGAFNCSEYGLESFDKVNIATRLAETPPLITNRTIYFNPCSPLQGLPECGEDKHFCEIDRAEINGEWVTIAVRPVGPSESPLERVMQDDDSLYLFSAPSQWGDFEIVQLLYFECSNMTSIDFGISDPMMYPELIITTPQVCGFRFEPPLPPAGRDVRIWKLIWYVVLVLGASLLAYVCSALFLTSRNRTLGPLSAEITGALRELPLIVRESVLTLYERISGTGTGRNTI